MNEKKARSLRKKIYGEASKRVRKYARLGNGQIVCDDRRRAYQELKKQSR